MAYKVKLKVSDSVDVVSHKTGKLTPNCIPLEKTGFIEIFNKSFYIVDAFGLSYLKTILSGVDIDRILSLGEMVEGRYNTIMNISTGKPHTNISLRNNLKYNRNNFAVFMSKLKDLNVIYYRVEDTAEKSILLNPYLIRKCKLFSEDINKYFNPVGLVIN